MEFEDKVLMTLEREGMLEEGDTVLVALSGGADSRALLHFFWRHRARLHITVEAFHLDHGQRPESREEALRLKDLCEELGVPAHFRATSVPRYCRRWRLSLEEGGRRARKHYMAKIRAALGGCRVATGHHLDDCAETMLMNLFRGSAARGLAGMRPIGDNGIIRPFLEVTRDEIIDWCRTEGLEFLHDPTNDDRRFLRNRIRSHLLPLIKAEYSAAVVRTMGRAARLLREEDAFLDALAEERLAAVVSGREPGRLRLHCGRLLLLPVPLARRVLRRAIAEIRGDPRDLSAATTERMLRLARARTGATMTVGTELRATKSYDALVIEPFGEPATPCAPLPLLLPGLTELPAFGIRIEAELIPAPPPVPPSSPWEAYMDAACAGSALEVRARRPGDAFHPLGLGGRKTLKRFFIDEKVPAGSRSGVPLVTADGEIAWIPGMRHDERFKITATTRQVLHLRAEKLSTGKDT